ncbi:MAG TPA: hypothetical protein VN868_12130 [Terriglobales bacterium]|jgi:hypothetical protein|nr:hypothetical protein [Terriglobales bacterium]
MQSLGGISLGTVFGLTLALVLSFGALGQQAAAPSAPALDNDFVKKHFGSSCTLNASTPAVTADLDDDGIEDIVIAARCKNPMTDAAENNFVVLDPYYAFYGFGDPKVTTQFATADPETRSMALLIIHGAGSEAWRAAEPKAKFLIVNLPYKAISVKRLQLRKRAVRAIYVNEAGEDQMTSALFWDGKKYRYQPVGSSME